MYFAELSIVLSTIFYLTNAFSLNEFNYIVKEIKEITAPFDSSAIKTEWLRQPLDHFNRTEIRTWNMRYFLREDFWKSNGPIFVFIGGQGTADPGFMQSGLMYELAVETNGAMVTSEHRYYGESKPLKKPTTEDFRYLSSRQALADLANLIERIKMAHKYNNSKVIVVGCSYAGNLAAWMKLLYPDLIDAAISSSGPVLAKADFFEYLETVSDDFEKYGTPDCYDKISERFNEYEEMFSTESGIQKLKKEEQICDDTDMSKRENQQLFFLSKTSIYSLLAVYGSLEEMISLCEQLSNSSHVFSAQDCKNNVWNERKKCHDYELDNLIEAIKSVDWYMSWPYQKCTEFGYFQITSPEIGLFTDNISLGYFYKMCTAIFGTEFNGTRVEEGVKRTNEMYGGLRPNVSHVVFVNGDMDPWHRLGVLEDISYDAPAKIIPRVTHCRDLFSNTPNDSKELKEARLYIKYLIKKWIGA